MSDNKIADLVAKIADAQRRLDEAELKRAPTTRIEGELEALQREHAKLISDQAEAIQAAQQAEVEAIEQAAGAETASIIERVRSVLPPITIPTPVIDDGPVLIAARQHARAQNELAKATVVLAEKQKLADDLAGLIAEHQKTLDQIGDRLEASAELPSDNVQRLRSFQFIERKRPLHAAAVAEVSAAEQSVRLAETVRRQASAALATADDEARRAGYVLRLEALDAAMLQVLGQAAAVNRRLHRAPQYIGSHELRWALQRLAIEYPVIAAGLNPADPRRMAAQRAAVARQMVGSEAEG
jgi:DNA repair exonuclease SbcCD ATPase subunit